MTPTRTLIVGEGGHGQVVADTLLNSAGTCGTGERHAAELAFVDDRQNLVGRTVLGLPVIGTLADLSELSHGAIVVAIGDNRTRADVLRRLRGYSVVSVVHVSAVVAGSVDVGVGTVILAGVVVNPLAQLGEGVILNTGCTVDHHNQIGPYAHVAPGAHLAGNVTVEEGALVGVGASIASGVTVGAWSVVGVGAAVVSDVEPGATVVGVPAKLTARVQVP